ncbi:MAG: hypothetical protein JWO68_2989 [Actinomycetia bacterium]|jgi:hypothetical protein|nr:hypothetical protein [Actinomycetes bacterium]
MAKKGFLHRQAQMRGLVGGSRPWTILWVLLATRRLLKRLLGDKPEVVYSEELRPGEAIVISAKDRQPRVLGG